MAHGPGPQPPSLPDAPSTGLPPAESDLRFESAISAAIPSLSHTARRNIENLGLTVAHAEQADIENALQIGAGKLREAVQSTAFETFLRRAISPSAKLDGDLTQRVFPDGQDHSQQVANLRAVALQIIDNAVGEFSRQSAGAKARAAELGDPDIALKNEQVGLVTLVSKKIAGAPVRDLVNSLVEDQKARESLVGIVRNGIRDAIGAALVTEGHTRREHLPSQRQLVNIAALHLDFLGRPDGNEVHNKMDSARMAIAARNQNPEKVREFLLEIDSIPRMPLGPMHDQLTLQLTRRMQRAAANLLQRHSQDPIGEAHFKTVAILKDVFSSNALFFHPYNHDNDTAVVDQIYRAASRGTITLAAASCPNYSGTYANDPKTGKPRWEYDFHNLGTEAGIVAERGLNFVSTWHQVLSKHLGADNVRFKHYEGTFEVAEGFKSQSADGTGSLPWADAVARLATSGEAVSRLYAERFGILAESHLTSEVIPDPVFVERKMQRAEEIRAELSRNPEMRKLAEDIGSGRLGLYLKWHPMDPATEDDAAYLARIAHHVVPENIAEYELLGEILRGEDRDTLVLAYDSPIMGEVYALNNWPVISGQGRESSAYLGA